MGSWYRGPSAPHVWLAQVWLDSPGDFHLRFIDITPGPALPRLIRGYHRVSRVLEMARGVAARRTVATADVAAGQAEAQVDPAHARFQALLTPRGARGHRLDADLVLTDHHGPPVQDSMPPWRACRPPPGDPGFASCKSRVTFGSPLRFGEAGARRGPDPGGPARDRAARRHARQGGRPRAGSAAPNAVC